MKNLVELRSVGCHVDLVEKLVYPTLKNGMPDFECPTPFVKDEMSKEWWDSLDWIDMHSLQTYNPYLS